eukprot:TRINITY_DN13703_c0_g1_i1.p1 TRINITY_DN13703_c0_g1~~TRINITY_DN13703_c0_g1_i1.p1  ORF type:complete len:321 (+),score=59.29 TRINITY_DN13703_c0_g1_i1:172-1134(+)
MASSPSRREASHLLFSSEFFRLDGYDSDDEARRRLSTPEEQQPLLTPEPPAANARFANRERFSRNQRTQAQRLLEHAPLPLCCLCNCLGAGIGLGMAFYVYGWLVYWKHGEKKCDQPLVAWLFLIQCAPLVQLLVDCLIYQALMFKSMRYICHSLRLVLLVFGFYWCLQSRTCAKTNPHLYTFVWYYLIYISTCYVFMVLAPIVVVALMIFGMWRGWFDEIAGASPETIEGIETISYEQFEQMLATEPDRPDEECCCCSEAFCNEKPIKRTPCGHVFHEGCLSKWLKVSTTCPLCRNDLEEAVKASKTSHKGASSSSSPV